MMVGTYVTVISWLLIFITGLVAVGACIWLMVSEKAWVALVMFLLLLIICFGIPFGEYLTSIGV